MSGLMSGHSPLRTYNYLENIGSCTHSFRQLDLLVLGVCKVDGNERTAWQRLELPGTASICARV